LLPWCHYGYDCCDRQASRDATAHTWHQSAACVSGRYRKSNPSCMGPPLQYKLSSTCQHARTPQWLLRMLHNQHGTLYDPCPHSPSSDGLYTPWSSSKAHFVNPPFGDAKDWLHKAAEEAGNHKHSIVLVPFRAHTKYISVHALRHAMSVCVSSKPIRFEDPYGTPFSRPLPTPVCHMSFGADLTLHPSTHAKQSSSSLWWYTYCFFHTKRS